MINSEMTFDYSEVIEKLSEPLRKKLKHSVELLRKAERLALAYDDVYGYYLAFSGGKDSQCLYHVAKLAGVKFKAHMNLTSIDPPEVIRFVKREYPDVELVKPKKSIFQAAVDNQILPTMRVRWCCAEYKETAGAGKVTLIGIRKTESARRAKRNEVEIDSRKFSGDLEGLEEYRKTRNREKRGRKPKGNREVTIVNADGERVLGCIRGKESLLISPIIDWTDEEVWEFLGVLGVKHCELYDEGWRRIGCIGCPMSSHKQKMIENKRYPHVKRGWIKAIKAIRNGGVFRREYIWWNIRKDWMPLRNVRGLLRTQAATSIIQTQDTGCSSILQTIRLGGKNTRSSYADIPHLQTMDANKRQLEDKTGCMESRSTGFSSSSSSDRLTEEQENEIAENIYDWWISGKSYKQWYAEKFQQMKLEF